MAENTLKEIKEYLGVESKELTELWKTMSEQEKAEWKTADLSK